MAQGADGQSNHDADHDRADDPDVAQLTVRLYTAIGRRRQARAAWPERPEQPDQRDALSLAGRDPSRVPLASQAPVELVVLTALAQTYGTAILRGPLFTRVLDLIAERGAVVLVQRVLWGERPTDLQLAARLLAVRPLFEALCEIWPEVLMAQAQIQLDSFRPHPPAPPTRAGNEARDDG